MSWHPSPAVEPLLLLGFGVLTKQLLNWFAAPAFLYYLFSFSALAFFSACVIGPGPAVPQKRLEYLFLIATILLLFACRWPTFLPNRGLNPDEGLWVAGAHKLTLDFAPWRGVDGTTSGPLNTYIVALPALIGLPITFFSTRVIGTALMAATACALYYAIKWIYNARVARLTLVPLVLFIGMTRHEDFVHYSSEYLSVFLIGVALAAVAYVARQQAASTARMIAVGIAGFCIGSLAFAKLQSVPFIPLLFLFVALALFLRAGLSRKEAIATATIALCAVCFVPAAMIISLWWTDNLGYAATSYVRSSFEYIAGATGGGKLGIHGTTGINFRYYFYTEKTYTIFIGSVLFVILLSGCALVWHRAVKWTSLSGSVCGFLLLGVSAYVIYRPQRLFAHYLLFSVVPFTFFLGAILGSTYDANLWRRWERGLTTCAVAFFTIPALSVASAAPDVYVTEIQTNLLAGIPAQAAAIARYAKPGDRVAIWGWAADYWVQTQTIMATRESATWHEIYPGAYRDFFRERYMSDLRASRPRVFVDAVGPNSFRLTDRTTEGHDCFPALAAFVSQDYTLQEEIDGTRIYVANGP